MTRCYVTMKISNLNAVRSACHYFTFVFLFLLSATNLTHAEFSCMDGINNSSLGDNLFEFQSYKCDGLCGAITVASGWNLEQVVASCVDGQMNTVAVEVDEDFDGIYSGFCARFLSEFPTSCTFSAKLSCLDSTRTEPIIKTIEKAYPINISVDDCGCTCMLGDQPVGSEFDNANQNNEACIREWIAITEDACTAMSPGNCEAAPSERRVTFCSAPEEGEECSGERGGDYVCQLNPTSNKCERELVFGPKTCKLREFTFENHCANQEVGSCPVDLTYGCGYYVRGDDGTKLLLDPVGVDLLELDNDRAEVLDSLPRCKRAKESASNSSTSSSGPKTSDSTSSSLGNPEEGQYYPGL